MIKCKRCFKKYDASEDACPRCGKINEYEDEREFQRDTVKDHEHSIEIENKGHYTCSFCGRKSKKNTKPCENCGNGHYGQVDDQLNFSSRHLMDMIDDYHESTGMVNFSDYERKVKSYNIPYDQWKFPKRFSAGTLMTGKQILFMFVPLLFLNLEIFEHKMVWILLPLVFLLGWFLLIRFFRDNFITKDLVFEYASDKIKITHSKDKKKKFTLNVSELKAIHVDVLDHKIVKIAFEHKAGVKVKDVDYSIDTSKYLATDYMKYILFIMCHRYDLDYHVQMI